MATMGAADVDHSPKHITYSGHRLIGHRGYIKQLCVTTLITLFPLNQMCEFRQFNYM